MVGNAEIDGVDGDTWGAGFGLGTLVAGVVVATGGDGWTVTTGDGVTGGGFRAVGGSGFLPQAFNRPIASNKDRVR